MTTRFRRVCCAPRPACLLSLAFWGGWAAGVWLLVGAARAENWPQFLGPTLNNHAAAGSPPVAWSETSNIAWKTPIAGRGWSSPVVWGDQVWLTTATPDGKQMFAVCVDVRSGAVIHNLKLFENEQVSKIHDMNSYASPTPALEEGRAYVSFGSYGLACLNTATGAVVWSRRDLPCEHFRGPGSSPLLYENMLISHYDGFDFQYVAALDKATGQTIWKKDRDIDYGTTNGDFMKAYCTPIVIDVGGRKQLISPTSKAALAYDPATGAELWRVRYPGFSATARPVLGDGLLYINTGFSKADLLAVKLGGAGDVTASHVAWSLKKGVGSKPTPLLVDDLLYLVDDAGVVSCVEAKTGELVWQQRLGGQYSATPLYAGGRIYLFSHDGPGHVLAPGRAYKELAVNTLDAGCMASPAALGDALLARTKTHLYRVETPAGGKGG